MNLTKTKKTGHKFAFIILFLSLLLSFFPTAGNANLAQAQGERKQVLYINSYHIGFKFSDEILSAITAVFKEQGNIDLRIEYLDTKHISDPEYYERIQQLFEYKYKDANLDLVMSSDDAALNFLFENADTLFPGIPVVFVGANFFDVSRLAGHERFTGISEEADIAGTLDIALNLHPETKRVVVVNDTTVTGQKIHQLFTELIPKYPQITFEFLEDVTMDEIRQRLGTLPQDSLALLTIFSKDKAGSFFEYDQFSSLVAESSSVPVYGTWDFSLGYGIVGGKLTSGSVEGERVAKLALRILAGEKPGDIPVDKQVKSRYMFDYKVLDKWGIDISRLPEGSVILDRPVSFYEENRSIIWGVSIGFIILIFIIAILAINNNQRRRAQAELAVSNRELQAIQVSLEQRVVDRTKALATSTEVSRHLSTILERKELVTEVVNQVKNSFGYYHAQIYFFDKANENLVMAGGTGEAGEIMLAQFHKIAKGRGLVGRAANSNKPILVSDTNQNPEWLPNPLLPETKSEAAVPISMGDEVLGVLDVQHNIKDGLQQEDVDLLQSIANQVAVALQNIQSTETVIKRAAELQTVARISTAASTISDVQKMLESVVHLTQRGFGLYHAHVFIYNENTTDLAIAACGYKEGDIHEGTHGTTTIPLEQEQSLVARAARTRQPVIVNNVRNEPGWLPNPQLPDTASELAVPLIVGNQLLGVLDVQSDHLNFFSQEDANIQSTLASQVAVALQNAHSFNQVQKQAERETAVNLITQKIQNTTSIESALKIAARELGHALGMKSTVVTLEPESLAGAGESKRS